MRISQKIAPCLWFNGQAEEAARFYIGVFPNSRILGVSHYSETGREIHRRPPGSVMTVSFELDGQPFTALNGGPDFKFNESVSLQVYCETQDELDDYWQRLSAGGDPKAQQCGWLKDRFGLSWQVLPKVLPDLITDPAKASGTMAAVLRMKKIDIAELKRAAAA